MNSPSSGIDPKFFNQVAQIAHFFTTYALSLTTLLWFKMVTWRRRVLVFVLILAYACFHEFYFDPRYENAATRGSDVEDWCFLMAGATVAEVIAAIMERRKLALK